MIENIIIWLAILAMLTELCFSPRIEITRKKDVLLFYRKGNTRDYIILFSL